MTEKRPISPDSDVTIVPTGCYTCVVACKDWYNIDAGPVNWIRVHTIENGKFPNPFIAYLSSPCYHCANPPCVLACPVNAITKRESDGIVVVDREKCDFCLERLEQGQQPIYVEACPMYALNIGPLDKLKAKYGDAVEVEGFHYSERFKPSVMFKPKRREQGVLNA